MGTRTEKKRRRGLASLGEKGGREEIDFVEGTVTVNRESRREEPEGGEKKAQPWWLYTVALRTGEGVMAVSNRGGRRG